MPEISPVERELLQLLLAGEHPALEVLRRQAAVARMEPREFSGVGFFTHFVVPSEAPRLTVQRWVIGDVEFTMDGLRYAGGALLFVEDGAISMLEAYLNADDHWPEEESGLRAGYLVRQSVPPNDSYQLVPASQRDLQALSNSYAEAAARAPAG
jgi:hypothetical protein